MRYLYAIFFFFYLSLSVNAQQPIYYWQFEGRNFLFDRMSRKAIHVSGERSNIKLVDGASGTGVSTARENNLVVTNLLRSVKSLSDFSLEFAFKGGAFMFTTYPKPDFRVAFGYDNLTISYSVTRDKKKESGTWQIPLRGAGVASYSNLANDSWHHFVLTVSSDGYFQIWIDGKTDSLFMEKIAPFSDFSIEGSDGFRLDALLDELAFYKFLLDPKLIRQHASEIHRGDSYTFVIDRSSITTGRDSSIQSAGKFDPLEFAPGYPEYTIQATKQLKSFPDPRYGKDHMPRRNFPWLDITNYLHRELPDMGGRGFGRLNPVKAVELTEEMVRRWNYYAELPCLRLDSVSSNRRYSDPLSVEHALVEFARSNPDIPTASVLMEIQGKPHHAGFERRSPFQSAQDLEDRYYLRGSKGVPIVYQNKKWLSPLASLDIIRKDAVTTAFYLRQLERHMGRPVSMLNENGEIFGHMRPKDLLEKDASVRGDMERRGLSNAEYNGWFQNRLDTCYKNEIVRLLGWKNALFTFYNVSAYNSNYWPDYKMRRNTNFVVGDNHFSTPSFYPSRPDNWRLARGSLNGYGTVAEGRMKELEIGDKLFAPFVSAGWGLEENNIRPAQWLALLKAMVMLGADFFHVGYFNVTGRTGWPDGVGPNDPRGYIYQVAMPSYAQAIASRVREFIMDGNLLNPQPALNPQIYSFRFKGVKENHLIMVRKLKSRYLIYGSVQPNSNIKGNVSNLEKTCIDLEGKNVCFEIRKQGSVYILDDSGVSPIFRQLDKWHQHEHPYYWKSQIEIEAENCMDAFKSEAMTEKGGSRYDFTGFITFVRLTVGATSSYRIFHKPDTVYTLSLKLRAPSTSSTISIRTTAGEVQKKVFGKNWYILTLTTSEVEQLALREGMKVTVSVNKGAIDIDTLIF